MWPPKMIDFHTDVGSVVERNRTNAFLIGMRLAVVESAVREWKLHNECFRDGPFSTLGPIC